MRAIHPDPIPNPSFLSATSSPSSGLLEITYDTGAKVILQGPVTYEVESKDGGSFARQVDREAGEEAEG